MAHPIYKYHHTANDQDLYGIWDTYSWLPETFPMDLATFLKFWLETQRPLEPILQVWNKLETNGTSLDSDDNLVKDKEKVLLDNLCSVSLSDIAANENRAISENLRNIIIGNQDNHVNAIQLINVQLDRFNLPRKYDYYYSYGFTYNIMEWRLLPNNSKLFYNNPVDLTALSDLFLRLFKDYLIPACAIPHVLRNRAPFREELIFRNLQYLIPDVSIEEMQSHTTFQYCEITAELEHMREYYRIVMESDYTNLAGTIRDYLATNNITIDEANFNDIKIINEKTHGILGIHQISNFRSNDGRLLLPPVFFRSPFINNFGYYILSKIVDQNSYVFSSNGDLILENIENDIEFVDNTQFNLTEWTGEILKTYTIKNLKAFPLRNEEIANGLATGNEGVNNQQIDDNHLPDTANTDDDLPF